MPNCNSNRTTVAYLLFLLLIASPILTAAQRVSRHAPGQLLIRLRDAADEAALTRILGARGGSQDRHFKQIQVRRLRVKEADLDRLQAALEQSGLAAFVEKDYLAEGAAVPNDPGYGSQWYLAKINGSMAWDISKGSGGVVVAVVDSGVDATHPDLAGKIVAGWNFLGANADTSDVYGHGTAVAGAVAAMTDNLAGISGIAWNNSIMPLVVLNSSNYASYSNIAAAIVWAADHGARAINVSLGGTSASSTLQSAVNYAWSKGAVVFAAAANAATSTPAYPAACDKVVAIGSTDESDRLASFSNYGTWIDLTAPGTSMLTTVRGGGYSYWQGTSFSTPLAAGVAALMWSVNPNLTAASLVDLLQRNSDDLGSAGFDATYGYGRLNAYKAVLAAQGSVSADTSAPTVAIGYPSPGAVVAGTMQVQGSALDDVAVTKVEFYVDGQLNGSSTLAAFSFAWNTATAANGAHTLAVKAYDAAGNAGSASLSTSVNNATAGRHDRAGGGDHLTRERRDHPQRNNHHCHRDRRGRHQTGVLLHRRRAVRLRRRCAVQLRLGCA